MIDNMEQKALTVERDAQIQVVVQNPDWQDDSINLGNVLLNVKKKKKIYAWVLVLCLLIGLCAPLLLYQFTKNPLTVSSVVTLNYLVNSTHLPVKDLTAPDGSPLDLNNITSAYVLQEAMRDLELSQPVTLKNLRDNISVIRILTEESRQQQEVASRMIGDKNTNAYTQVQNLELNYENKFIVTLTNGFGEEDSRVKNYLKDNELRLVLDRILDAYNSFLVRTYSELKLPNDEISIIDFDNQDFLDSLDQLRTAVDNLTEYADEQTDEVKSYRSWQTGKSLTDWMEDLQLLREIKVDYLYSYVYNASLVKDYATVITDYHYMLRNAETQLGIVNNNIKTVQTILDNYKNDEIFVTMQESDSTRATQTTTDYYNELILEQAKNYSDLAVLEERISDLQDKIASIDENNKIKKENERELQVVSEELRGSADSVYAVHKAIVQHINEIMESPLATTFVEKSAAQGKSVNFLVGSAKNMAIGAVAGAVIACGLWFLSALAPEFLGQNAEEPKRKSGKEEKA